MRSQPESAGVDARFGDATFIVWSPRHKGTRSAWLASELGIADLRYFSPTQRRGLRAAPLKYPRQLLATWAVLARRRPVVVFVQSPPSLAAWAVALYASFARAALVIDAHSDAFERAIWTRPRWLNALVARRAAVTLVTGSHWAERVRAGGGEPLVVPAVPTPLEVGAPPPLSEAFNVAVVNTWAPDEPLQAIVEAAGSVPQATFHITGDDHRVASLRLPVSPNVRFTGFLPEPTFHALLAAADAVMCLTTRDHTMQNGAAEALYLGTPIITSDWPVLRDYFSRGTVHVDNTAEAIATGVRKLIANRAQYDAEIRMLRDERMALWREHRSAILRQIDRQLTRLRGGRAGPDVPEDPA